MNSAGGVEVLEHFEEQRPVASEKQVVGEVGAAGVNFMDVGARRGLFGGGDKPTILGVEGQDGYWKSAQA